jgi:Tfp pilus assembly protein PilN
MRAVNLLPSDLRGAAAKPARSARPEPVQGIGAYVVLGALALFVAALASYVLLSNGVKQREADLVVAQQRNTAASAKATALKPYADFEARANARVETVRGLAAARFDWEQSLRDLSRAVPSDVKLQSLAGDMGLPGATGSSGDPLRGSIAAPAITLVGCASSHDNVARMLARVRAVDGVTRVSLSKTEAASNQNAGGMKSPCGEGNPPTFSAVAFFERSETIGEMAPAAAGSATTVPVPNAVNGTTGSGTAPTTGTDGTTTPADGQAATSGSTGTSTTTSTTTGGTP